MIGRIVSPFVAVLTQSAADGKRAGQDVGPAAGAGAAIARGQELLNAKRKPG
jgi:hypothetical protein